MIMNVSLQPYIIKTKVYTSLFQLWNTTDWDEH